MNFQIICEQCGESFWTRGYVESDTNALVLDENDPWDDACEHIKDGGDYKVSDSEYDDEP